MCATFSFFLRLKRPLNPTLCDRYPCCRCDNRLRLITHDQCKVIFPLLITTFYIILLFVRNDRQNRLGIQNGKSIPSKPDHLLPISFLNYFSQKKLSSPQLQIKRPQGDEFCVIESDMRSEWCSFEQTADSW